MKKDEQTFYIVIVSVIVLGFILWWFLGRRHDKPTKHSLRGGTTNQNPNYNCIKVDIEGSGVREWINFTFTIDGVEYDTVRRFVTNHRSHILENDNSVNDNLLFRNLWKDGEFVYLPSIIDENSNVSVKTNFLYSEYYPKSRITSYKASVFNCP